MHILRKRVHYLLSTRLAQDGVLVTVAATGTRPGLIEQRHDSVWTLATPAITTGRAVHELLVDLLPMTAAAFSRDPGSVRLRE